MVSDVEMHFNECIPECIIDHEWFHQNVSLVDREWVNHMRLFHVVKILLEGIWYRPRGRAINLCYTLQQ